MRFISCFVVFLTTVFAQQPAIHWEPVVTGLRRPTHATNAGDGSNRLFLVEQEGVVRVLWDGQLFPTPFLDIRDRVNFGGELGLLSIAFPPYFAEKQYFYVYYIDKSNAVTISRFRVSGDSQVADPATETVLLNIPQPYGQHNGGMMAFSPVDGYLYIGTGDGGYEVREGFEYVLDPQHNGQRTDTLLGKMLRIDTESGVEPYVVPEDNPHFEGGLPEVWATGFRNPWRFSFDRETGDLYIGDVGNNIKEEVNFEPAGAKGRNYGWSIHEGTFCLMENEVCPEQPETVAPLFEYDHDHGCSIIGGIVYRGFQYEALRGAYIFGDFCNAMTWTLRNTENGVEVMPQDTIGSLLVSFAEDESGEIYAVDYDGALARMTVSMPETPVEEVADSTEAPPKKQRPSPGSRLVHAKAPNPQ